MDNIAVVVSDGLCTGCGTCAGICPFRAITMHVKAGLFLPTVEEEKCTKCDLCVRCCPGHTIDFVELNSTFFEKQPGNLFLGNLLKCYVGHSETGEVRNDSSSGGIVTQMLIFALEKGIIDGALVTRMSRTDPLLPEPFIARSKSEILSASKSKYCPVPANVVLHELLSADGRFAVVGLPCQMHGIRKAEALMKGLSEKIAIHVGLFCSHTVDFRGTDCLIQKLHVESSEIARLDYRGSGWPGFMTIHLKNGENLKVKYSKGWTAYWNLFSPLFFAPVRCLMCPDQCNELADLSIGDAWLPELKGNRTGESILISRTENAEKILSEMEKSRLLSLKIVTSEKVMQSQDFSLNLKKKLLSGRFAVLGIVKQRKPEITPVPLPKTWLTLSAGFLSLLSLRISSNKYTSRILAYVPFSLLRLYFGLFRIAFILTEPRR